jgi:hypothetical protein
VSILGTFVLPADVAAKQARLLARAQVTDADIQKCGALDQGTRAAWGVFYTSIIDLVNTGPTFWGAGGEMDQTETAERELLKYQETLKGTCALSVPPFDPSTQNPETAALLQLARYAVVIAGVAGTAYVIGQIVSVLPKGRGR